MDQRVRLLIICGVPFAGKSTLARELARQLPGRRIDIDELNAAQGRGAGGDDMTQQDWDAIYGESFRLLAESLAAGVSVVYDGHCWTRWQRDNLRRIAEERGATTAVIFVTTSEEVGRARWQANRAQQTRHDVSDENFASALAYYEPPQPDEIAASYDGTIDVALWVEQLLHAPTGK
jgi:predicted kinase